MYGKSFRVPGGTRLSKHHPLFLARFTSKPAIVLRHPYVFFAELVVIAGHGIPLGS